MTHPSRTLWLLGMGLMVTTLGTVVIADESTGGLAPGYGALPYSVPKPGSYTLPNLGAAADGQVLESTGQPATLHGLYAGRMVLLSFIYATCDDANGCPLATMVLHRIQSALQARPELKNRLRLITLSFNPAHDTPEVMAKYGENFQSSGIDWHFLTTRSETELQPILRDYQQSVDREVDAQGHPTGQFSHLLRVYLIDEQRWIRNSYTVSVLHPDLVLADIETLRLESSAQAKSAPTAPALAGSGRGRQIRLRAYGLSNEIGCAGAATGPAGESLPVGKSAGPGAAVLADPGGQSADPGENRSRPQAVLRPAAVAESDLFLRHVPYPGAGFHQSGAGHRHRHRGPHGAPQRANDL